MAAIPARVSYLDVLRGIAITLVIASHVGRWAKPDSILLRVAPFGQLGVQLFFMVSGFALTLAWSNRRVWTRRDTRAFFLRRWFRIAPGYYAAIALYFLVRLAAGAYSPASHGVTPLSVYRPAAVAANLVFANGFWAPAQNTIVPGGWSIGAEFFFYLLFPIIVTRSRTVMILCALAVPASVAAVATVFRTMDAAPINDSFVYFLPFMHLPCFVSGIMIQRNLAALRQGSARIALGAAAVLGTAAIALLWPAGEGDNLFFLLVPSLSVFPFAWLIVHASGSRLGESAPLRFIGERSFSMYLNHFVFVDVFTLVTAQRPEGQAAVLAGFSVIFAASYIAACVTYRFVELPFMAVGRRITGRPAGDAAPSPHAASELNA
jgi:exopolysaccharide production protein ExoZ